MSEVNIFEQAVMKGLRFATKMGNLTVEDVYSLPLKTASASKLSLDILAKDLNRQLKNLEEESFVDNTSQVNTDLHLAFDIVKHVIGVKKAQKELAEKRAAAKEQRNKIREILAGKQDAELHSKSVDELQKLLREADTMDDVA